MKNLQELKDNYENNQMKTIVVSQKNYNKLKELGFTGESFNTVVERLIKKVEDSNVY